MSIPPTAVGSPTAPTTAEYIVRTIHPILEVSAYDGFNRFGRTLATMRCCIGAYNARETAATAPTDQANPRT
jgi:hypothetical protein